MRDEWLNLCRRLAAHADPERDAALWICLDALYQFPHRAYHSLSHVEHGLTAFRSLAFEANDLEACEMAIWLHDAVYEPRQADNEPRRAIIAGIFAREFRCSDCRIQHITDLVLATRHDEIEPTGDCRLIVDVDLAVLRAPPDQYDSYAAAIRDEYSFADHSAWAKGRSAFLSAMLARRRIYCTDEFHQRFGRQARENLARELQSLTCD